MLNVISTQAYTITGAWGTSTEMSPVSVAAVNPGYAIHAAIEAGRPIGASITMIVRLCRVIYRDHLTEICSDMIRIHRDIISTNHITKNWSRSN